MKFPDFSLTWNFFIFQNVFPDRGNPVNIFLALTILANSTDTDAIPPSGCSLFAKLMDYGRFK